MPGPTELSARILVDPAEAKKLILQAFRDGGANVRQTARMLGVSYRTLHRAIERLKLDSPLAAIRDQAKREGWLNNARWPKTKSA